MKTNTLKVCGIVIGAICYAGASLAATVVPGTANPFYAGRKATGPDGKNNDGTVPPRVAGSFPPGTTLGFVVSGGASHVHSCCEPLDGSSVYSMTNLDKTTGIAGIAGGRLGALLGVFEGSKEPTPPAPARLNFLPSGGGVGISFATLHPKVNQIFFIGDGLTGSKTGKRQGFVVPAGATRLYLAVDDGYGWYDNSGKITVTIKILGVP